MTLVPKKEDLMELNDFRHIYIVGSIYRIISKVLANKLKKVIPKIIDSTQVAFIQG